MSSIPGNITLALAALVFSPVFTPFFHTKVSTSNDQGASGYMIILVLILHLLFLGLLVFTSLSISRHGGFDWISSGSFIRTVTIGLGLTSMVTVSAISVMFRFTDASSPAILESVLKIAPTVIFILLIGTGFILNNETLRSSVPLALYKIPLAIVSILCLAGLAYGGISAAVSGSTGLVEATRDYENAPAIISDRMDEIREADATADFVRILEFTGGLYPTQVREAACAKIKSHPTYQNELVSILNSDSPMKAFGFLSFSEVDDKTLFPTAIDTGIINAAAWIRHSIQGTSPSEFYADRYSDEVTSIIKTADRYSGMGVNFLPSIKKVRSALDEPFAGKQVKYYCTQALDDWIKNHS